MADSALPLATLYAWDRATLGQRTRRQNPVPADSDFLPEWATNAWLERKRIREALESTAKDYRESCRESSRLQRVARARALREAGATYRQIGFRLGVSIERARQLVRS